MSPWISHREASPGSDLWFLYMSGQSHYWLFSLIVPEMPLDGSALWQSVVGFGNDRDGSMILRSTQDCGSPP